MTMDAADRAIFETAWAEDDARWEVTPFVRKLRALALAAPCGSFVIPKHDGTPYLGRVYLTPPGKGLPGIKLHYFFAGDSDAELHNHPWKNSVSLILANGYTEMRMRPDGETDLIKRAPGDVVRLKRDTFHRVLLDGARPWTLFATGMRVKLPKAISWGFLDTKSWMYTPQKAFMEAKKRALEQAGGIN